MKTLKFFIILGFLILFSCPGAAQTKREQEFRILKSQFPEIALRYIEHNLADARQIRFYKEVDSAKVSFEAKFKKDRLKYSAEFSADGVLEDIEYEIKKVDIPEASFVRIEKYLQKTFVKHHILRMQQQYPVGEQGPEKTIKDAFQNLMLPTIKYELIVGGKKENGHKKYEIVFDAEGQFESYRVSLPPNYDHVLY